MSGTNRTPERPGESGGRPQLTRAGIDQLEQRVVDIRERRLPEMRPLLIESERDERVVAEFERLIEEADGIEALLAQAQPIAIDPLTVDGRPVHPEEAFLDEERISASSPLALAIVGAQAGETVWVDAPTGAWPCEVLGYDLEGVALEA
jgi:Transcription elongation factor, GreA/GreB, C-term